MFYSPYLVVSREQFRRTGNAAVRGRRTQTRTETHALSDALRATSGEKRDD